MNHLLFTVRWLDERYHGLIDREGPPEWPPSPYRLFQALVAGLARGGELDSQLGRSLEWLQTLAPPLILVRRSRPGQVITRRSTGSNTASRSMPSRSRRFSITFFTNLRRGWSAAPMLSSSYGVTTEAVFPTRPQS